MKKILCCISASIITALSVNSSIAATNSNLSSLRVKSESAKAYISGTSAGVSVGVNKASDVASNIKVTGLPSGIKALYSSECDSLSGKAVCRIQFKGDGTAKAGSYLIAITGDGMSAAHLTLTVADPHLRISSGLMDNPTKPLEMTMQNMSDATIHLSQLSVSHGSVIKGWKLSDDECSHHALLPQQSCTYSIASSSNEAGNHATVMVSAPEVSKPILKDIVVPYPKLKVSDASNRSTVTLNDNDTKVITLTNSSPYIAVPKVGYQFGDKNSASSDLSVSDTCGQSLAPSASCAVKIKTGKIASEQKGHEIPLTITANGNNVLSTLNVALNDPDQLQFSVAPRQYPAFEDIVVTNTNADTATIKYLRMTQGTDISFKDHPNATDPDTTPVCKFGLQLATNQQCHIWLHAKTGALTLSPNNYQFKATYSIDNNKIVKEIDGDNRSVLYLGGTDGNGKPMLAAYNGFSYESFADLTDDTSANSTFPDGSFVLALATDANGTLYYGGDFSDIENSQTQAETVLNHIGAWSGSDFVALKNNIKVGVDDTVRVLNYNSGSDALYIGGDFSDNSSLPMNYVASIEDGAIQLFDKNDDAFKYVTGSVHTLASVGQKVYFGGDFQQFNNFLSADFSQTNPFDGHDIGLDAWFHPETISISGSGLYLGGYGDITSNVICMDGDSTWWYAPLYANFGTVFSTLKVGNQLLTGGDFNQTDGNQNTAAFGIFDYGASAWLSNTGAASSTGSPYVLSILPGVNGLVYIAGHFDSIDNGISAQNLAVYDSVHNSFIGVSNSPFANGSARAMAIGSVINVDSI